MDFRVAPKTSTNSCPRLAILAISILAIGWGMPSFASPMFQGIGFLPNAPNEPHLNSRPRNLSDDGSTIVGVARDGPTNAAFVWTADGGMLSIGQIEPGSTSTWADGVSADGSTVVGRGRVAGNIDRAFRWTAGSGMQFLDAPDGLDITDD